VHYVESGVKLSKAPISVPYMSDETQRGEVEPPEKGLLLTPSRS
jgi:hypothetical protein